MDQPQSVPRKIYLELRHLSASFFRVPVTNSDENPIKQYYQPLASYKTIKFNRFTLTNEEECRKRSGKSSGKLTHLKARVSLAQEIKKKLSLKYDYIVNLAGYVDHSHEKKTLKSHYIGCKNIAEFFLNSNRFVTSAPLQEYID